MKNTNDEIRLFSYKMTDDSGFVPNPFQGFLTLAYCKSGIRDTKVKNDWIAGFTSKILKNDEIGKEKLVFLMKVTDKVTFKEYWEEEKYKVKKRVVDSPNKIYKCEDNIYNHGGINKFKEEGSKSNFGLISNHFYYFGRDAIEINKSIRPRTPISQANYGWQTYDQYLAQKFLDYFEINYKIGRGRHLPHDWDKSNC